IFEPLNIDPRPRKRVEISRVIEVKMRQDHGVDVFGAVTDFRQHNRRRLEIVELPSRHGPAGAETRIDEDGAPFPSIGMGCDQRINHRHFDEALVAAGWTPAHEVGGQTAARIAKAPNRVIVRYAHRKLAFFAGGSSARSWRHGFLMAKTFCARSCSLASVP